VAGEIRSFDFRLPEKDLPMKNALTAIAAAVFLLFPITGFAAYVIQDSHGDTEAQRRTKMVTR
jgi:hypothetical protein